MGRWSQVGIGAALLATAALAQARGVRERDASALQEEVRRLQREVEALQAKLRSVQALTGVSPEAVASATFVGRVKAVGPRRIDVLDQEGNVYELQVDERTRAFRGGERIAIEQIPEGAAVEASLDLISGTERARDIVLLPVERGPRAPPAPANEG